MFQRSFVFIFILVFSLIDSQVIAQVNYPRGEFINPLNIPLSLSGNFGELRNNHFHSGLDFRTNSEEGYLVMAVADGYVSRIKVSALGYGNALYITHPNGYVSVYGHLLRFDSTTALYVKQKQYELESFEVDLFPKKNEIKVKQGQLIALTGNTGGSEGPHLHFEIRDEKTEEVINPFFFGFEVADTLAPTIEGLAVYALDKNSSVNGCPCTKYFEVKKVSKNKYSIPLNQIECSGNVGFALVSSDTENGSSNKNGTYSYELKMDNNKVFKYTCNRFSFDQTHFINAHIDFAKMKKSKERYQRCYLLPGNKLKQYEFNTQRGAVNFNDTLKHIISITASDFKNNNSTIEFVCKSKPISYNNGVNMPENIFYWNKVNAFKQHDFSVELPSNCLYEDVEYNYRKTAGNGKLLSDIHEVHKHHEKLLIVSIDKEGKQSSEGGTYENGYVITKTKNFGKFAVTIDTTLPVVKLMNYDNQKLNFSQNKIMVKAFDTLSGIKSYRGTIDGNWVLMEFDNKEKTLCYVFDEKLSKTSDKHEFSIVVTDKKGNAKKTSVKFVY
jgi:murein DD-endopeptidase MepM/ murein hydrolase activator NlpD